MDQLLSMFSASLRNLPAPLLASVDPVADPLSMEEGNGNASNNFSESVKGHSAKREELLDAGGDAEAEEGLLRGREEASPPPTGPLAVQLIMTDILAQQVNGNSEGKASR